MTWLVFAAVGLGAALFVRTIIRPLLRRRRKYDAGSVSEYWIQQQRGRSNDATR